jgi:predicted RNA binding protein YcfA (HicA-like mRNA interferase family)
MTADQVMNKLKDHGWIEDRTNGSHHIFVKEGRRSIPVPKHGNRDLGPLAKRILKEAGIND